MTLRVTRQLISSPCTLPTLLALVTLAVFWPLREAGFIRLDDAEYVTANPLIKYGLSFESFKALWTALYAGFWAPLLWLSFMIDVEFFGLNPGPMHIVNILWHTANVLLLFVILYRATGALWRSVLVAALFAIHPLRVESVAWVTERKDVLSAFFGFGALWAYIAYTRSGRWFQYGLLLACFACSLMVKPMLVTLPAVLLLLDYWPLGRLEHGRIRRIVEKIPLIVVAGCFAYLTLIAHEQAGGIVSTLQFPWSVRIKYALTTYVWYLVKLVWPSGLAFFYPHAGEAVRIWEAVGAALMLTGVTAGAFLLRHRAPYLIVGWLWYLGTLIPTLGLVQAGAAARADRFTYLPLIGITVMIVWGLARLTSGYRRLNLMASGFIIISLIALLPVTRSLIGAWQDTGTLTRRALTVTHENFMAETLLGMTLADSDSIESAIPHFQQAMAWNSYFYMPYVCLGKVCDRLGRTDEALRYYAQAFRLDAAVAEVQLVFAGSLQRRGYPDRALDLYLDLLRRYPFDPNIHQAAASVYEAYDDPELAAIHYAEAARLDPQYASRQDQAEQRARAVAGKPLSVEHYLRRGRRLAKLGAYKSAVETYTGGLVRHPGNAVILLGLGDVYREQEMLDEARTMYARAVASDPRHIEARLNLGGLYLKQRQPELAIAQYDTVLQIQPDHAEAHFFLGNIRLAGGDPDAAAAHYEAALRADPSHFAAKRQLDMVNAGRNR